MERIAFALLFLGLLTGSAFAKDKEGTWKYRTYLNGVIMVDHEGQTYTGKCRGTTIGGLNTPVQEIEGCKDAEGFASEDYPTCSGKNRQMQCMKGDQNTIEIHIMLNQQFVVVTFKTVSVVRTSK
jgi:hypothetical protein